MIPKKIHYCWFGHNPLPLLAKKCIDSWKKNLPDYEIIEWNEDNFDVNIVPYTQEAYKSKKYAFVSDYARFWILYNYGGIYFDTDVEVLRPMNHIVEKGAFMGCENEAKQIGDAEVQDDLGTELGVGLGCNPGLGLGCESGHDFFKEILDFYSKMHFINTDGSLNLHTVVEYTTDILVKHGLKNTNEIQQCAGITIYPNDYFCPKSPTGLKIHLTDNTVTIHHFNASWKPLKQRLQRKFPNLYILYTKLTGHIIGKILDKIRTINN